MTKRRVLGKLYRIKAIILLSLLYSMTAFAKDDVVVLKNGDRLTGEIVGMQSGQLKFYSDYMIESVRLDWARIERLESKSTFMILLVDGKIITSVVRLLPSNSQDVANFVIGPDPKSIRVPQLDVIRLIPANAKFSKLLEGSVDFGFSFNSGNDQYQTELVATATYRKGPHSYTAAIDSSFSGQPQGTSTRRNQFTFDYRKQLTPLWYAGGVFDLLHSDQQSLDLRTSVGALLGRNLKQSEDTRLSVFGGLAVNRESYTTAMDSPKSTNADAMVGADFITFRFGKTDLRSRISLFPSLTTPGRMRLQVTSNLKFKIARDLYVGFHVYENFDSKPPVRADKNDLGVSTSLGWKF